MDKLSLSFYTNIPTPYQDDFFNALNSICEFKAVFYAKTESDRNWENNLSSYKLKFLNNSFFAKIAHKWFKDFHFSSGIFALSYNESADWIVLGGNYFALNNLIAAIILKIRGKRIAFFTEKIKEGQKFKFWLKKMYLKYFLGHVDVMIYIGECARQSYHNYGFSKKKFVIIPYNIDIDLFDRRSIDLKKLNELKENLNVNGRIVILSSGSLIYRKGMDIVIDCFNSLEDKYKDRISLIILGSGEEVNWLKSKALSDQIKFLGFKQKNEIPYYFAISDIFLFCSRYDGWGLVINEAIASELAIICSDAVGASECIHEGINGYVIKNQDLEAYKLAIYKLLDSPELLHQMKVENTKSKVKISSQYNAQLLVSYLNSIAI
ncbi:MAG: glycosyltransferase family 4 protein [Saprospiraceae bacterium]